MKNIFKVSLLFMLVLSFGVGLAFSGNDRADNSGFKVLLAGKGNAGTGSNSGYGPGGITGHSGGFGPNGNTGTGNNGGYGPGDGTGNSGVGPADGTGFGAPNGAGDCPSK